MANNRGSGKGRAGKTQHRKCLVTGETYPTSRLIRFVIDPDGRVIPDVAAKLPGRGGWILAQGSVLEEAMKKKIFIRFGHRVLASLQQKNQAAENLVAENSGAENLVAESLEMDKKTGPRPKISVAESLPDLVVRLLRQRCLDYLGFANRAGLLVSGFEKVRARLVSGKCRVLITAQDGSADGRRKICSGLGNILDNLRMIDMFTREQLGQALGLPNAVHVALGSGGITESFFCEFSRYESVILQ